MLKHLCVLIGIGAAGLMTSCVPTLAHAEPIVSHIHRLCAGIGIEPGNYDFYLCTQTLAGAVGIPPGAAAARDPVDSTLHAYGDFYHTDWRESERHACAGLGLPVGSGAFLQCVANLDMALNNGQNYPLMK